MIKKKKLIRGYGSEPQLPAFILTKQHRDADQEIVKRFFPYFLKICVNLHLYENAVKGKFSFSLK